MPYPASHKDSGNTSLTCLLPQRCSYACARGHAGDVSCALSENGISFRTQIKVVVPEMGSGSTSHVQIKNLGRAFDPENVQLSIIHRNKSIHRAHILCIWLAMLLTSRIAPKVRALAQQICARVASWMHTHEAVTECYSLTAAQPLPIECAVQEMKTTVM